MSGHHEPVNKTADYIGNRLGKKKTWKLANKITELLDGHPNGRVMAALAQVIVEHSLEMSMNEEMEVIKEEATTNFTELVQALRRLHEENLNHALGECDCEEH